MAGPSGAGATSTPRRRGFTVGRVLVIVAVVSIAIFWSLVFAGWFDKRNPDYLTDRAFVTRTADRCAEARRSINRLPPASDSPTAESRAAVVDQATDRLQDMVDAIAADHPTNPSDARIVTAWVADWRVYLANRRDYARRLRRDPQAQFLVDQKPRANDSYDRVIKNFADINDMPDCGPTLDVG